MDYLRSCGQLMMCKPTHNIKIRTECFTFISVEAVHAHECINEWPKNKTNFVLSRRSSAHYFPMNLWTTVAAYCSFENKAEAQPVHIVKSRLLELFYASIHPEMAWTFTLAWDHNRWFCQPTWHGSASTPSAHPHFTFILSRARFPHLSLQNMHHERIWLAETLHFLIPYRTFKFK